MDQRTAHTAPGRTRAAGGRAAHRRPRATTRHRPASVWLVAATLLCILLLIVAIGHDVLTTDPADDVTAENPTRASMITPTPVSPGADPLESTPIAPHPTPRTEIPEPPLQPTVPGAPIVI